MMNSRGWLVVLAIGLLLAGFLGVMIASRAIDDEPMSPIVDGTGVLGAGMLLPDVAVVAIDGMATGLLAFARDGDLIVWLLSADCGPCDSVVTSWSRQPAAPGSPRVVGVYSGPWEAARGHVRSLEPRFPLLCDTAQVFISQYAAMAYPTAIGVRRGGRIAYIRRGFDRAFGLAEAAAALRQSR